MNNEQIEICESLILTLDQAEEETLALAFSRLKFNTHIKLASIIVDKLNTKIESEINGLKDVMSLSETG